MLFHRQFIDADIIIWTLFPVKYARQTSKGKFEKAFWANR